ERAAAGARAGQPAPAPGPWPIEWVVLEDVALDARPDGTGALVASTSARQVAEHLGVTPGAAARALGALRSAGLVTHLRQPGEAGRFGLSAYVLGPVPGLDVVAAGAAPCAGLPRAVPPPVEGPRVADRHMAEATADGGAGAADAARRDEPPRAGAVMAPTASVLDHHNVDVPAGAEQRRPGRSPDRRRGRAPQPPAAQLSILDPDHPTANP
ncbi:MAG: hypothetical protein M3Q48_17715, partial [Actinomycetota bacterium]|nr:hypothetical protein [Actinomycetota bacterium]